MKRNLWRYIKELAKEREINVVIFEDINYIHKRTKDSLNLFRLLGAIECLEMKKVSSINVLKVKEMTKRLLKGTFQIAELE